MKHLPTIQLTTAAAISIFTVAGISAVGAPVDLCNTYHLTGTIYLAGKQQPWEIWGRHTPYFFYEQQGGYITQDDGTTVRRVYGPSTHRKVTVAVVGAVSDSSRYDSGYDDIGPADLQNGKEWPLLTNAPSWKNAMEKNRLTPASSTASTDVFSYPVDLYTSYTGSPTNSVFTVSTDGTLQSYALEVQRPAGTVDVEKLTAEYNVDIPADILAPLDTDAENTYDVSPEDDTTLRGQVKLKVVGVDRDGDILIDVEAPSQPGLTSFLSVHDHVIVACQDNGDHIDVFPYIETYTKEADRGDGLILISPAEPLPKGYHPVIVAPKGAPAFNLEYTVDLDPPIDIVRPHQTIDAGANVDEFHTTGDLDTTNPLSTMSAYGLSDGQIKKYVDTARAARQTANKG